jgi:TetR/AcrR family transcriptional regulator
MSVDKDISMEQNILETAEELFLDKGFALTSTTEIARKVGCNQALVHYYFRTKEKLFETIFERLAKTMVSSILRDDDPSKPFEERLRVVIESHFDMLMKHPKLPFFFFNELITNPKRLDSLSTKLKVIPLTVLQRFSSDLQAEIDRGRIRPMEPIMLLLTIVSLNITPFLVKPIFQSFTEMDDKQYKAIMIERKKENVRIIMRSLVP